MRDKFIRFMYGRNGVDQFSRFLIYAALICVLLDVLLSGGIFYGLGIIIMVYSYFRIFSKNLSKRRLENAKYLQLKGKFTGGFADWRERRRQSKDYAFFRCPSCKAMLRVPRGKGRIRVTCRKCGNSFERRT